MFARVTDQTRFLTAEQARAEIEQLNALEGEKSAS